MPSINDLTCQILLSYPGQALAEYGTRLAEANVVETYVPVPAHPLGLAFTIHLFATTKLTNMSAFVYIDGVPQANRHFHKSDGHQLDVTFCGYEEDLSQIEPAEADADVDAKAERSFVQREWRFVPINPQSSHPAAGQHAEHEAVTGLGTIEVVVLRSRAKLDLYRVPRCVTDQPSRGRIDYQALAKAANRSNKLLYNRQLYGWYDGAHDQSPLEESSSVPSPKPDGRRANTNQEQGKKAEGLSVRFNPSKPQVHDYSTATTPPPLNGYYIAPVPAYTPPNCDPYAFHPPHTTHYYPFPYPNYHTQSLQNYPYHPPPLVSRLPPSPPLPPPPPPPAPSPSASPKQERQEPVARHQKQTKPRDIQYCPEPQCFPTTGCSSDHYDSSRHGRTTAPKTSELEPDTELEPEPEVKTKTTTKKTAKVKPGSDTKLHGSGGTLAEYDLVSLLIARLEDLSRDISNGLQKRHGAKSNSDFTSRLAQKHRHILGRKRSSSKKAFKALNHFIARLRLEQYKDATHLAEELQSYVLYSSDDLFDGKTTKVTGPARFQGNPGKKRRVNDKEESPVLSLTNDEHIHGENSSTDSSPTTVLGGNRRQQAKDKKQHTVQKKTFRSEEQSCTTDDGDYGMGLFGMFNEDTEPEKEENNSQGLKNTERSKKEKHAKHSKGDGDVNDPKNTKGAQNPKGAKSAKSAKNKKGVKDAEETKETKNATGSKDAEGLEGSKDAKHPKKLKKPRDPKGLEDKTEQKTEIDENGPYEAGNAERSEETNDATGARQDAEWGNINDTRPTDAWDNTNNAWQTTKWNNTNDADQTTGWDNTDDTVQHCEWGDVGKTCADTAAKDSAAAPQATAKAPEISAAPQPVHRSYWRRVCSPPPSFSRAFPVILTPDQTLPPHIHHQVGTGTMQLHTLPCYRSRYLDSFEQPYAVFRFRYRSAEVLKQELGFELQPEPDYSLDESQLERLDRDQLVHFLKGILAAAKK